MGELLLEGLALADVAAVQHDAADVLVVEKVGVLDLEPQRRTVPVADRALDRVRLGVARAVDRDQLREQGPVGLAQKPVESRSFDLVDAISEQTLDRGALVRDQAVGVQHRDQVAGVRDERAEPSLALASMEICCQRRPFDRERDLRRECAERVYEVAREAHRRRDDDGAANFAANGERGDDRRLPFGEPEVASHVRRWVSVQDAK